MKTNKRPLTAEIVYKTNDASLITRIWQMHAQQSGLARKLMFYRIAFWLLFIGCLVALTFIWK